MSLAFGCRVACLPTYSPPPLTASLGRTNIKLVINRNIHRIYLRGEGGKGGNTSAVRSIFFLKNNICKLGVMLGSCYKYVPLPYPYRFFFFRKTCLVCVCVLSVLLSLLTHAALFSFVYVCQTIPVSVFEKLCVGVYACVCFQAFRYHF